MRRRRVLSISVRMVIASFVVLGAATLTRRYGGPLLRKMIHIRTDPHHFDALIREAALRHAISADLIRAVIRQESAFNPRRVGAAGEIGLMQITPDAARDWCAAHGIDYRFRGMLSDPRFNIEVGTWYLARGLKRWQGFRDAEVLALAEYNAGRSRAIDWAPENPSGNALENVEFSSTKTYINRILDFRASYAQKAASAQ